MGVPARADLTHAALALMASCVPSASGPWPLHTARVPREAEPRDVWSYRQVVVGPRCPAARPLTSLEG
jgi:hypothetical protein